MIRPIRRLLLTVIVALSGVVIMSVACSDSTPTGVDEPAAASFEGTRASLTSSFDEGVEGWTIFGDAEGALGLASGIFMFPEHDATGGNPGGAIFADDDAVGVLWFWRAPPKFLGNRLGTYGGRLEFDLKQNYLDYPIHWADVVLAGAGMVLVVNAYPEDPSTGIAFGNPGLDWTHYSIELAEGAGWKHHHQDFGADATAAELRAVLKDLVLLHIRGEYRGGYDRGGLDNVRFVPPGLGD